MDHEKQSQEERAKRLRQAIEDLKRGAPAPNDANPSLREQIAQRESQPEK